jgi:uncharacterized SAM-binding protein YcdF (DUF218 family)
MFYYASKIISALIWPSNVIALMLVAGLVLVLTGWFVHWGRRLLVTAVVLFLACSYLPIGNWLVLPLEQRFARGALPERLTGILILGGFEVPGIGHARGELALNEAAERLTEALRLAYAHPEARVAFTGGAATMLTTEASAAETVSRYLQDVGVAPGRIVLESRSRTTHENALYLKQMLSPKPDERWALVTSAFHMPRAMGTFRNQGFDAVPWPVDYRTRGWQDLWTAFPNPPEGLQRVDFAFKEWLGLLAYRLSGRSTAFWPGPDPGQEPPRGGQRVRIDPLPQR